LDFLQLGIDIEGVDISPEMLAICREKAFSLNLAPTLHEQPIERLSLSRHFRTILASSSVLQLITAPDDVRQAMARLFAHLADGGVLIAPFMTLWREGMSLQREWENAQIREKDGALLHRMGRVWYDPQDECEHTEDLYQVIMEGEVVAVEHHRRSPAGRSYTQRQARELFVAMGFNDIHILRAFNHETAPEEEMMFTVIGVRNHANDTHVKNNLASHSLPVRSPANGLQIEP
jgi:hypothetical protein